MVDVEPLQRAVVDVHARVVAGARCVVDKRAERQIHLIAGEDGAIDEVDPLVIVGALLANLGHRVEVAAGVAEAQVAQADVRKDRLELDLEPQRVAERAVRVGKGLEQIAVLVVGPSDHGPSIPHEHLHLEHRLMRQPVAERRGLDAQPGHGAAERDRLELRHDERHQPVRQRGIDEALVRRHPLYVGGPGGGIDGQDAIELAYVQAGGGGTRPRPEEVRGLLGEPDRVSWRNAGVLLAEAGLARLIRREGPGGHQATLPLRLSGHERGYC